VIITRTPFRISFFGGGTDYPVWFEENGGAVLSTTIDKYCYITCRYLPQFFQHKHRIVYSKVENVKKISEIKHPAVRAVLTKMKMKEGIEIHHDGDLPARSGLGSSSSFTVGLINAVYALRSRMATKYVLAKEAIDIERHVLRENVGSQDQVAASYGGLNKISFSRNNKFCVEPVILDLAKKEALQGHLMLFFTGLSRIASRIAKKQIASTPSKGNELRQMYRMVDEAKDILTGSSDISEFGNLLHKSWLLKKSLTDKISNPDLDGIYSDALKAGATGGKVLGAGGGGFMLFFVKPAKQHSVRKALKGLLEVKFKFENAGSQVIFCQDQGMR